MNKSAGFMHRPKIPKNPKIFRTLKIFGFLGILGLCMNPALCSSGFLGIKILCMNPALCSSNLHRPKIPKNPDEFHAQAQDSQESQDFEELSGKTRTNFQKILGFLGILGLCMNSALCSSGFLGILGLCRFYEGLM